jgi:hypothetical protein
MPLYRRTNTIHTQPIQQLYYTSPGTRLWRHRLTTDKVPWEDPKGEVHQPKGWSLEVFSGMCDIPPPECVLSQHWRPGKILHHQHAEEAKQGSSDAICVHIKQVNSYLKSSPYLYGRLKVNSATKWLAPLDDADLMTHLLWMCHAKWQRQYDLMEKSTPPSTKR